MTIVKRISEPSSIATMDVVFIHGLNGNLYKAWTNNENCFWPELLKEDLPEADLWTVGYDSSPTKWKKESLSFFKRSQSISVCLKTEGIGIRPVCFIGHSLGGLVIKQVLIKSIIDNKVEQNCDIYDNTRCVVFFATPHRGSELANLFSSFSILRTTKLVNYLKCNEDPIEELYYFYRRATIPTLTFHETERTPLFELPAYCKDIPVINMLSGLLRNNLLSAHIVSDESADCGFGDKPIPIENDHNDVCKFSGREDSHYKMLLSFLRNNISRGGLVLPQDRPLDLTETSKIDTKLINIKSAINEAKWEESSQLISECEEILDNNTQLPNRAKMYFSLAETEKSRVNGLSNMTSQEKDYTMFKNLIAKARRANE